MGKKYRIIYADPPWHYKVYSKKGEGRSAENHYHTMEIEDIRSLPVADIADDDCILFLWITFPCLLEGISVMQEELERISTGTENTAGEKRSYAEVSGCGTGKAEKRGTDSGEDAGGFTGAGNSAGRESADKGCGEGIYFSQACQGKGKCQAAGDGTPDTGENGAAAEKAGTGDLGLIRIRNHATVRNGSLYYDYRDRER